jgi:hypothetical protein
MLEDIRAMTRQTLWETVEEGQQDQDNNSIPLLEDLKKELLKFLQLINKRRFQLMGR